MEGHFESDAGLPKKLEIMASKRRKAVRGLAGVPELVAREVWDKGQHSVPRILARLEGGRSPTPGATA